jgi:anaerobic ribonucleoside-triphosphate reductase activating protein
MLVGRILSPVHSLGPGNRVCLWTQGCNKKCYGCISPELQSFEGNNVDEQILADMLVRLAKIHQCKGLTVSGGDPFEQSDSLFQLLKIVRKSFDDILVYTGYELDDILNCCSGESGISCLKYIDVLIDGPYIRDHNVPECVLRGSDNQIIHYLNEKMRADYENYLQKGRVLESFCHDKEVIITGMINEVKQYE